MSSAKNNPMACGELSPKRCRQLNYVYDSAIEAGRSESVAAAMAWNTVKRSMIAAGEKLPARYLAPKPRGYKPGRRRRKNAKVNPAKVRALTRLTR